jgi:putative transposase
MPRLARSVIPGFPLHVVQRGINRNPCFFASADYDLYLDCLAQSAARFACSVHAYCLMSNHIHLLLTPREENACGLFMKHLGQRYVQTINRRLSRTGTLWEGRFHSCPVRSDNYVLACYRYIELNPVRAGMVGTPAEYSWSSYCANAQGGAGGLLQPHLAYEALGSDPDKRASAYKELCKTALPLSDIQSIRKATRVGAVIGAPRRSRGRPWAAAA